jgi:hypothetical protein
MDLRRDAVNEAARRLLMEPAIQDWMVWHKWEVLDLYVGERAVVGEHADHRVIMAVGCIKADIAALGIGRVA